MKKILITLLVIFTFSVLSFSNFSLREQYFAIADSGFDAGYGGYGGYGSGGSYWDDDDDDDYYSGGSSGSDYDGGGDISSGPYSATVAIVSVIIVLIICSTVIIKHIITMKGIKNIKQGLTPKKHINHILKENFDLKPGNGNDDPLVQTAYENYVKIQIAWMNRDLTPVRHLLTDEIYNMYQMQVETLIEDNQINVMSDFKFVCGKVKSRSNRKNIETTKIYLCVQCKDYIKDASSNDVINGSRDATITYIYELTFIRDTSPDTITNCPTCGAPVKKQMSTTCAHCHNSLLLTSPDMTMANKKIIHQFKHR